MRIKKNIVLVYFLMLMGGFVFPQYGNVNGRRPNANFEANLSVNNILRGRDVLQDVLKKKNNVNITLAEIEGEPYIDKKFLPGNIYYKDSLDLGQFLMRYNAYLGEMEVSNPNGSRYINKMDGISIVLNNEKYMVLDYGVDGMIVEQDFFIEKFKGSKSGLYVKYSKILRQGKEAKTSFHTAVPPKFISNESYYLKFGSMNPVKVKLRKNNILRIFPNRTKSLKKYIAEKNLKMNTLDDLVVLLKYYETLK
ncbi:hypothetical protein D2V08_14125 [Flagellimonas lutimaris]|uniref:Uncharacterized protein n=1 Tax=Flagellimonas lutimaris TaxID=475082 RepID=A0A3A1N739_9FLAO|nr:hypothetical protein [Allomuricauda lutimaris]RIV31577.1 hypothetical protein D2V08_14125 [Allomuricauda lutimaris]